MTKLEEYFFEKLPFWIKHNDFRPAIVSPETHDVWYKQMVENNQYVAIIPLANASKYVSMCRIDDKLSLYAHTKLHFETILKDIDDRGLIACLTK